MSNITKTHDDTDVVLQFLKNDLSEAFEIIDHVIIERKVVSPSQPRKFIELYVNHKESGRVQRIAYNYSKIKREIERVAKYGN